MKQKEKSNLTNKLINSIIKKFRTQRFNISSYNKIKNNRNKLQKKKEVNNINFINIQEKLYKNLIKKENVNVTVSCLCPGPVDTNFNNVANVSFSVKPLKADYVAKYAVDNMFKNKMLIIPGFKMKMSKFFGRFLSDKACMKVIYGVQKRKLK